MTRKHSRIPVPIPAGIPTETAPDIAPESGAIDQARVLGRTSGSTTHRSTPQDTAPQDTAVQKIGWSPIPEPVRTLRASFATALGLDA